MNNEPTELRLFGGAEIRATDTPTGARQFTGRAVPWDTWTLVGGLFYEKMQRNCFRRSIQESAVDLPLLVAHDYGALPVGKAVEWRDEGDGLHAVWQLAGTEKADEVWTLIRDGSLSGLSVGFSVIPKQDAWEYHEPPDFDRVVRRNCILREVSVVPVGQYPDAVITNTRSASGPPVAAPHLTAWRKWADTLPK